jgi:Putative Actinobacterial Holin-X, holin superfamily III
MTDPETGRATGQGPGAMMVDVLAGVTRLVQGELALARAEAAERLEAARQSVIQVLIAVVLSITAINVLAGAVVAALVVLGLTPAWAAVVVGGLMLLLALGFAQQAARLLREAGALPKRSAASVKRDVETLQMMVRRDATT